MWRRLWNSNSPLCPSYLPEHGFPFIFYKNLEFCQFADFVLRLTMTVKAK